MTDAATSGGRTARRSPRRSAPCGGVAATDGAAADEDADGLNVPGRITTEALTGTTSGSIGDATAAAQSVATVFNVNLLNGLITASSLTATVSSTSDGARRRVTRWGRHSGTWRSTACN